MMWTSWTGQRYARGVLAALAALLLVAGCASLPESSAPQALNMIDKEPVSAGPPTPIPGRDPDLLLHDFLQATADPTAHHQIARQYLSPSAAEHWDDSTSMIIVDKPDSLRESRTADSATYWLRARQVGDLDGNGAYRAVDGLRPVQDKIEMVKVGAEWRINDLPSGVVIEDTAFSKHYKRCPLYFANTAGTAMVPDLRWVAIRKDQLAGRLLAMLAQGPQASIAPAVRNLVTNVPEGIAKANGDPQGVGMGLGGVQVDLIGASTLDSRARDVLAAQVISTLFGADIMGPYVLLADGKPLDERFASGWSINDLGSLNPQAGDRARTALHAVRDGALVGVDPNDAGVRPAPGYFGSVHNLQSVALSQDGQLVAAVADNGRPANSPSATLLVGSYDGNSFFAVAQATTITRPSWTADAGAAWAVLDGNHVVRAVHDRVRGTISREEVDASAVLSLPAAAVPPGRPAISELRVDRSGTRVAMVVNGRVYIATVAPQRAGGLALTTPFPIPLDAGAAVVSLDWIDANSLLLARDGGTDPVETVAVDGFRPQVVTSQNLTPPVRVVVASPGAEYVTDARAVLRLQSAENSEPFWREVPGLGAGVVPVLPQ